MEMFRFPIVFALSAWLLGTIALTLTYVLPGTHDFVDQNRASLVMVAVFFASFAIALFQGLQSRFFRPGLLNSSPNAQFCGARRRLRRC